MKKLVLTGSLLLAASGVQAQGTGSNQHNHPDQAYTTLGPAGAGVYRSGTQREIYSATGNVNRNSGSGSARNPR
jgi:hypothetical protein